MGMIDGVEHEATMIDGGDEHWRLIEPTAVHPFAAALAKQFATWDATEKTWELHIPFPSCVEINMGDVPLPENIDDEEEGQCPFDAMLDIAGIIESIEGLTYNNVGIDNDKNTMFVVGIAWE